MNKPQIIINGVRAADFTLKKQKGYYILNDLMLVFKSELIGLPHNIDRYELPTKKFAHKIYRDTKVIWNGFFISTKKTIVEAYINADGYAFTYYPDE